MRNKQLGNPTLNMKNKDGDMDSVMDRGKHCEASKFEKTNKYFLSN